MSRVIELGGGHVLRAFTMSGVDGTVGYVEEHPDARDPSKVCSGSIYLDVVKGQNHPRWHVEQEDPLTLTPSILCTACGNHGFVRDGKWVPA